MDLLALFRSTHNSPNPLLMELVNSETAASVDVCVKRLSG